MKILYVIDTLTVGGAELLLLRICKELLLKSPGLYNFTVVAVYDSGPLQDDFERAGIRVISLNLEMKRFLSCVWRIYKCLVAEKPDIVHTHLLRSDKNGLVAAVLACIKNRISTIHNMEPTVGLSELNAIRVVKLCATKIIAVSESVKRNVVVRYGYKPEKISVIHTAPSKPISAAEPKKISLPAALINLANVKESKGQLFLIAAALEMLKITRSFHIDIYGDYRNEYGRTVNESISSNGLTGTVFLKGYVSNPVTLLPRYSIMISLSLFEGFPLAIIEGMSAGLPLILSDIPPHRELIGEIDDYVFVRPDDPVGIARFFERLISDKSYYSRLSGKMIKRSGEFSIYRMIDKYDSFYRSLIAGL